MPASLQQLPFKIYYPHDYIINGNKRRYMFCVHTAYRGYLWPHEYTLWFYFVFISISINKKNSFIKVLLLRSDDWAVRHSEWVDVCDTRRAMSNEPNNNTAYWEIEIINFKRFHRLCCIMCVWVLCARRVLVLRHATQSKPVVAVRRHSALVHLNMCNRIAFEYTSELHLFSISQRVREPQVTRRENININFVAALSLQWRW